MTEEQSLNTQSLPDNDVDADTQEDDLNTETVSPTDVDADGEEHPDVDEILSESPMPPKVKLAILLLMFAVLSVLFAVAVLATMNLFG